MVGTKEVVGLKVVGDGDGLGVSSTTMVGISLRIMVVGLFSCPGVSALVTKATLTTTVTLTAKSRNMAKQNIFPPVVLMNKKNPALFLVFWPVSATCGMMGWAT